MPTKRSTPNPSTPNPSTSNTSTANLPLLNIAVVGCGAIVERQHLPNLLRRDDCRVVALVEREAERALALAERFDVRTVLHDYRDLPGVDSKIDAAIIGLPNHLHAPATIALLEAGVHVLVEKPMALTVAECDAMIEVAKRRERVLAVGLIRRFGRAGRFAKWAVESGLLGPIQSFDIRNGFVFNWGITTDFFLRRELAGGGVFIDLGAHTLDQLLWWLGDVESFTYRDDSYSVNGPNGQQRWGVEADCEAYITMQSGATGIVEMSRTRDLRNTAILRGERAELEVHLMRNEVTLRFTESGATLRGQAGLNQSALEQVALAEQSASDLVVAQHDDFLAAVRGEQPTVVSGKEARRSMALIEACYAARRPLALPWVDTSTFDNLLQQHLRQQKVAA